MHDKISNFSVFLKAKTNYGDDKAYGEMTDLIFGIKNKNSKKLRVVSLSGKCALSS